MEPSGPVRSGAEVVGGGGLCLLHRAVVLEQRQRVAVVDLRPGEAGPAAAARHGRRADDEALPVAVGGGGRRQGLGVVVEEAGVDPSGREVGVGQHGAQEGDVGLHALDAELREGPRAARHRVREVPRRRMRDHLGQQRVEAGAGAVAAVAEAVGAHAGAGGRVVGREQPAGGAHLAGGRDRLHVDAGLDRVAAGGRGRGVGQADVGQRLAPGDAQLRLHQVDAGDGLRHGVLDLQAGVGLDEEEGRVLTHPRGVDQELEGAEVVVGHVRREADGRVGDAVAQVGGQVRRRRDLDDLLVAALHRAFALADMGHGAVPVAHDLHLDVPGPRQVLLDVQGAVAEGARRLRAAALERLGQLGGILHGAGAAPAAAGDGLEHDRPAHAEAGQEVGRLLLRDRAVDAGDRGHIRLGRRRAGAALVAEQLQVRPRSARRR